MQDRNYLGAEIGIEPEDLAFFRLVAQMTHRTLEQVVDDAVCIGADAMRTRMLQRAFAK